MIYSPKKAYILWAFVSFLIFIFSSPFLSSPLLSIIFFYGDKLISLKETMVSIGLV